MDLRRVLLLLLAAFNRVRSENIKLRSHKVAVIGAGVSGLISARYLKEIGANFTVFELTPYSGGTWRFEPRVGIDEYGDPISTTMYKNMRTVAPKPNMQFPGFPLPEEASMFPADEEIYAYLYNFIKHFKLDDNIKYNHRVTNIERLNDKWKVTFVDRKKREESSDMFDYIIVGTGHYSKPNYPKVPGEEKFKGKIIHSHDYRFPEPYQGKRVLMVGAGHSATEISIDILPKVAKIYLSSRKESSHLKTKFPSNLERKPGLKEYNETGIFFVDGTYAEIDEVIYGTGYIHYYPFLDKSCELTLAEEYVAPLYRQIVNINQPTMFIVGVLTNTPFFPTSDAQARYAAAVIGGSFTLPSKERMMAEWQAKMDLILQEKKPLKGLHLIGLEQDVYYANLTAESGIARVPPVITQISHFNWNNLLNDQFTFRNYFYTVLDENTFEAELILNKK